ncbi:MAG: ATP-binding cassette domain-containing protein [Methanobrevibacter sp.]|jgi:energy-coupling factor transport system ATP-binding protein|nr:ATP-binding cassette domain-containing protein [Candidatus Methanovirga australis]
MEMIKFENYNFSYENRKILENINLTINKGEILLICGLSGSGKTTLLANLKNEIKPNGNETGNIYYKGENLRDLDSVKSAAEIGFLFQNPDNQFVTDTVIQEISFALENIGVPTEEIRTRVSEMATFFGLEKMLHKNVDELSGGQKQLVNLCSLLILKPEVLILDEPTSQLDPIASYDFLSILRRLNEEFNMTILITEHKVDDLYPFIDKVAYIEDSKIKYLENVDSINFKSSSDDLFEMYLPSPARVHNIIKEKFNLSDTLKTPISLKEGINDMYSISKEYDFNGLDIKHISNPATGGEDLIKCKNLWFGYERDNIILKNISLNIKANEFVSLLGSNGSGKSTFLKLATNMIKPIKGSIKYKDGLQVAYVHQNPMIHFTTDKVAKELGITLKEERDIEPDEDFQDNIKDADDFVVDLVKLFNLGKLLNHHPYDNSVGEQQRIAIVQALITRPDVLFLDEPSKGIDPKYKAILADRLKQLQSKGLSIFIVTHDIDFAADNSDRCILLFDGSLQVDDTAENVFTQNNFYTTLVHRMLANHLPNVLTLKDLKEQV